MERKNFYLSYSKISTYIKCPLRYKFIYVDNLPTQVRSYFSLGNSVHKVLEKFYSPTENFKVLGRNPYDYLFELLDAHWISEGFRTKEEEEKAKSDAKMMLTNYYRKNIFGFTPAYEVETEFSFPFGGMEFKGRLDRVDLKKDKFAIFDYKTSNYVDVLFREEDFMQPVIYKIAGDYKYGEGKVKEVKFYYLRKDRCIDFEIDSALVVKIKKRISDITENIFKGTFPYKVNGNCASCEFKNLCEGYALSKLSRRSL